MKNIKPIILLMLISGCSNKNIINDTTLPMLTNDELCIAMGKYNKESNVILKLHAEIMKREKDMDFERCHVLESSNTTKDDNFSVQPIVTPPKIEHIYDEKEKKYKIKETGPGIKLKIIR